MGTITGSREEAQLLIAIIDNWCDGLPAAEDATIEDPTIASAENLLDLVGGYREQYELLQKFRGRLMQDVEHYRTLGGTETS